MPASIGLPDLERLLAEGVQVIDVLAPNEYVEQHLPGAVNIPLKQLGSQTTARLDHHKPIAVYCHDAL
jgi:rhodanese-related sulfurtransferase